MRSLRIAVFTAPLLALLMQLFTPNAAVSLPLFARKYNAPCTLCHVAFPRLNAIGMKFRQNGYRMPDAKGESPWESPGFPLSLVGNVGTIWTNTDTLALAGPDAGRRVTTSTNVFQQNAVEFHTAGTLAENVSFHFDNGFAGPGGVLESGMAFVQFDDIAKNGALNVKAGIFDAELPYLADSRRTTAAGYLSPTTLDGRGIELNGTRSSWTYAAGVVNSDRTTGKDGAKTLNNMENLYAWLMRDVNGQLVAGRVFLDRQDPRIAAASASQHLIAQGSAYLNSGRWMLIPGYSYEGFADTPDTAGTGTGNLAVHSLLLEGTVLLDRTSRWVLTSRYELRHVPQSAVTRVKGDDTQFAVDLGYYVNPNAKIAVDWTHNRNKVHDFYEDDPQETSTNQVQVFAHVGY